MAPEIYNLHKSMKVFHMKMIEIKLFILFRKYFL